MSLQEQSASDAQSGASLDSLGVAKALRLTPDVAWPKPANVNTAAHPYPHVLKRSLDLAIAVTALILLSPLLVVFALIVRLDSRGPALFRQTRLGKDGKPFDIFKFRSMTVMENGDCVVQAKENDGRVTRAGKWLRSTSLDELPQLLNVIAGDMSLVGPRPHARCHDLHYAQLIPTYALRQTVKPGITGWAQVNGHRGETPNVETMQARVDLDIWYAKNASPLLDLEILLRTPLEMLSARNAR